MHTWSPRGMNATIRYSSAERKHARATRPPRRTHASCGRGWLQQRASPRACRRGPPPAIGWRRCDVRDATARCLMICAEAGRLGTPTHVYVRGGGPVRPGGCTHLSNRSYPPRRRRRAYRARARGPIEAHGIGRRRTEGSPARLRDVAAAICRLRACCGRIIGVPAVGHQS